MGKLGYSGINLENVKISNRSAILKLLNDCGAMSRKDIALQLGLTPASVSLICTELIADGILREKGEVEEEKRAGRKKILVGINYSYRFVLSVCIESAETCIAISDLKGRNQAIKTINTDGTEEPRKFIQKIAYESKSLMWEHGISKEMVLGVGVSVPGPVKREAGISLHAYRIWNSPVPVGEWLREEMDCPVIVENNVKAFAEGELVYGNGKEQENLLFIKWGPGVGSAIIIDHQLYDSQNSKTAEIGHYIVEKNGALCRCGRRGCLETRVATHVIVNQIKNACTKESMPKLFELVGGDISRIGVRNIRSWIEADDPGMWEILNDIIDQIARVAVNTITLLAPDKVIIYGSVFELPHVEERFIRCCSEYDPSYRAGYILKSDLSDQIDYIGPTAVVVNELFLLTGTSDESV